jgi:ATP-dependent RNA helicase DHX37/DHR1
MKSMHIDAVVNFPFPTPLDRQTLSKAEKTLTYLGALTPHNALTGTGGHITDLGRAMSLFPLSPRFSRLLVTGQQHGCLMYVISMVSALSVGDPFIYEEALEQDDSREVDEYLAGLKCEETSAIEARRLLRKAFYECQHVSKRTLPPYYLVTLCLKKHASLGEYTSDIFKILSVSGAYDYAGGGPNFCSENFVRPKVNCHVSKFFS